jgi:hypothetical protein
MRFKGRIIHGGNVGVEVDLFGPCSASLRNVDFVICAGGR